MGIASKYLLNLSDPPTLSSQTILNLLILNKLWQKK